MHQLCQGIFQERRWSANAKPSDRTCGWEAGRYVFVIIIASKSHTSRQDYPIILMSQRVVIRVSQGTNCEHKLHVRILHLVVCCWESKLVNRCTRVSEHVSYVRRMTRSSVQSKGCFDRRVSNEHCMLSGTVFGLACSMAGSSEQISTSSNRVSLWVRYQEQAEPKLSCPSLSWMIVFQTDEESSLPLKIILITTC